MYDVAPLARATADDGSPWRARLDLEVTRTPEGARLGRRSHVGPLRIQRPFFPEGSDILHLYLLHPPGGVVGGDELRIGIDVRSKAHALLTTPAAQKLYRSSGATSQILTELRVEEGGHLEWLPAETIVYSGALSRINWHVRLDPGATFLGWEAFCLGRPASNSPFELGQVLLSTEVEIGGRLELCEYSRIAGGSEVLRGSWGLNGNACFGTLLCASPKKDALHALNHAISQAFGNVADIQVGITGFDGLSVLRVQGARVRETMSILVQAWKLARPLLLGHAAHEPRIWST